MEAKHMSPDGKHNHYGKKLWRRSLCIGMVDIMVSSYGGGAYVTVW